MLNTYWGSKGTYQADYDRLVKLMPASGNCNTIAGELIRSATRLTYDFYNNGMGNNTSGAANFLKEKGAIDRRTYETVYDYTRGRTYNGCYGEDTLHVTIVAVMDQTIAYILANPELEFALNTEDMFDYEDEMIDFCEECDVELDGWNTSPGGYICEYCYAHQCEEEEDYDDYDEY